MPLFLYRCANKGENVQAWTADDPNDDLSGACAQAPLVNPKTGRILGFDDE
jgi:hypothetical protein